MQGQRQDDRPYIRRIDFVFYNEGEIRAAVLDARNDSKAPLILNGSGCPDPTANEVIRRLTPLAAITVRGEELKYPERWLIVVDKTYAWCKRQSGSHYEIARRRYSGEHFRAICMRLLISENVFYTTMEKVRIYAALQAAQLNLIYVE